MLSPFLWPLKNDAQAPRSAGAVVSSSPGASVEWIVRFKCGPVVFLDLRWIPEGRPKWRVLSSW